MRWAASSVEPVLVPKKTPIEGDAHRDVWAVVVGRGAVFATKASLPSGVAMTARMAKAELQRRFRQLHPPGHDVLDLLVLLYHG